MSHKTIPLEKLIDLHESLIQFPPYSRNRRKVILKIADENNVSEWTVRRQYYKWMNLSKKGRRDKGVARVASTELIREWITMVAAVKLKMSDKNGGGCSTKNAIDILEKGIVIENKKFQLPIKKLTVSTTNRWLRILGIQTKKTLEKPLPSNLKKRRYSNSLWQMSISPSNTGYFKYQIQHMDSKPYFFSVTDSYSGVVYAEYRYIQGADVKSIIEFIYHSAAPKKNSEQFPFRGIPESINFQFDKFTESPLLYKILERKLGCKINLIGDVAKNSSQINSFSYKSRSNGLCIKLQRDFELRLSNNGPDSVKNINEQLFKYLVLYNSSPISDENLQEPRIQSWKTGLPSSGCRNVCDPDTFKSYFTEQEHYFVNSNSQIIIENRLLYSVDSNLTGNYVEVFQAANNPGIYVKDTYGKIYGPYRCTLKPEIADTGHQNNEVNNNKLKESVINLSKKIICQ